ncbi:MAG TPA: YidC/Oxa1 family membrane protein insertase [Chloroflexota bacterium]|nr:YidC/Oxa1 family membrane protein insertase [Chloroflexota bacterium]
MQNIFGPIITPMELGVVWLALAVGSAGIGIILFTIFVRLVLSPLQIVQLRNARAMQRLQPLIAELRKKHSADKQRLQEATMALYKEHKINPAMGCLPMLLQIPILFGLFYALMHLGSAPNGYPHKPVWAKSACGNFHPANWTQWWNHCYSVTHMASNPQHVWSLFHANFLWLSHGLGQPDPLFILPLLAGVTQWVQSRMMLTRTADPQQQMMNSLMNFMPLIIIFFAARYPSGLSLYWVTSTLIGILIQYRITGWGLLPTPWARNPAVPARPSANGSGPNGGSSNGKAAKTSSTGSVTGDDTDATSTVGGTARARKKVNRSRGGRSGRRG